MQIGERSQVVVVDKNSLYHLQQPDNITTAGFGTALSRGAERMLDIKLIVAIIPVIGK